MRYLFFSLFFYILNAAVMAQDTTYVLNPFKIEIDSIERIILVNFEKDPDSIYHCFEPQFFDDAQKGKGFIIIGWRVDGRVDVYAEPQITISADRFSITGKGLAHLVQRDFSGCYFDVDSLGVQACFRFNDIHNRKIEFAINENNSRKGKPFGLLAPVGDSAEAPLSMPLIFLQDFYFVKKKGTDISVCIDGKSHQPGKLPIPIDGSMMYFCRYSTTPLIAAFNPAHDGLLERIEVVEGQTSIRSSGMQIAMENVHNNTHIQKIVQDNDIYPVEREFIPSFPDVLSLKEGQPVKGSFDIKGHPSTGKIAGRYLVMKQDHEITIQLVPSEGWKPVVDRFSLRLVYTAASFFQKWPATYQWTARIWFDANNNYYMKSGWERIRK